MDPIEIFVFSTCDMIRISIFCFDFGIVYHCVPLVSPAYIFEVSSITDFNCITLFCESNNIYYDFDICGLLLPFLVLDLDLY